MAAKPKPKRSVAATVPGLGVQCASATAVAEPADVQTESAIDWRAKTLAQMRRLVLSADADILEERKWIKPTNPLGVPVWSSAGIVCTGETYSISIS